MEKIDILKISRLNLGIAANALEVVADLNCACEPGGGMTDLEPGFICGLHHALDDVEQLRDSFVQTEDDE